MPVFKNMLEVLTAEISSCQHVWFGKDKNTPPPFSYQVNFPRLEFVLNGVYTNEIEDDNGEINTVFINTGDVLFIPPHCWNKPHWDDDCSVLSLLFGNRQLGFSLVTKKKDHAGFIDVQKYSVPNRTGHAIDHMLEALNALAREPQKTPIDKHLIAAILFYCLSMLNQPEMTTKSRSEDIYHGICIYIQENFQKDVSREHIANRFNISPNHLSRLFRQQGHMTLADYITWVRIDRAKFMLKRYDLRLSDIATRCGFKDINYFFRVFKERTGLTPSQYKQDVHTGG